MRQMEWETRCTSPVIEENIRHPDEAGWEAQVLNSRVALWIPGEINVGPVL